MGEAMPGKPSKGPSGPVEVDLGALASKKNFDQYRDHPFTDEADIPYFDFLTGKGKKPPVIVTGADASEYVILSAHDDQADMGGGGDVASGGPGNDTISGGDGDDILFGDTDLGVGNVDWEVDDELNGDAGDDFLAGDALFLFDQAVGGDDTLNGGTGNDTLWGDGVLYDDAVGGADVFVFDLGSGHDTVKDFEIDKDLLDVSGYGFTGIGQIDISETVAGTTVLLNGGGVNVGEVFLEGISDLDADDFIFAVV